MYVTLNQILSFIPSHYFMRAIRLFLAHQAWRRTRKYVKTTAFKYLAVLSYESSNVLGKPGNEQPVFLFQLLGSDNEFHFSHKFVPHVRQKRSIHHTKRLKSDPLVSELFLIMPSLSDNPTCYVLANWRHVILFAPKAGGLP